MNRRILSLTGILLATGLALTATASLPDLNLDSLMQRNVSQGTTVVPDRFLREWDPVTVFYAASKGARPGPEDSPDPYVEMEPPHPGAWTWLDTRTLQFRPAIPWTPFSQVTVRADGRTTTLPVFAPPPIATSPRNGTTGLDPVERIGLTFSSPISAERLRRRTTIELRALPGLATDPDRVLGADDFEIKILDRDNEQVPAAYEIVLEEPIPRGLQARVRVALATDEVAAEAVHQLTFATATPFRAVEMGCTGSRAPISPTGTVRSAEQPLSCDEPTVVVSFNERLDGMDAVLARNLIRFEPAVSDLSIDVSGRRLSLSGRFETDTRYRMALVPTQVRDIHGRFLDNDGESAVYLRFPPKEPYLRFTEGRGIVERKGPHRLPIEGRDVRQVDVRVHRVDPTNTELWPFVDRPIQIDETQRPPSPGEGPGTLPDTQRPSAADLSARLRALGSPGFSGILPVDLDGVAARTGLDIGPALDRFGGRTRPGHYLVGLRPIDGGATRSWMRIQVTDLVLTTIQSDEHVRFSVSSLATGAPITGARITAESLERSSGSPIQRTTVLTGTTGNDGSFTWQRAKTKGTVERIRVSSGGDALVLDPRASRDHFANGTWLSDRRPWLQSALSGPDLTATSPRELGHLFTERPLYRPDETVHLAGYLRRWDRGRLTAYSGQATLEVRGPDGNTLRIPTPIQGSGRFHHEWKAQERPAGSYHARILIDGVSRADVRFQVESYRLPTFEVSVDGADGRTTIPNDRPFDVTATASYYAGGKVTNQPIRWTVSQFPLYWQPNGLEAFHFSSDGRYSRTGRLDSSPNTRAQGRTGVDGSSVLTLQPGTEPTSTPRTYVVEAEITGADGQTVTATRRIDAVPAFVLGLDVPRHVDSDSAIPIRAVAIGPDGLPVADQPITLRLIHRQWHSVLQTSDYSDGVARYVTDTVDQTVSETTVQSAAVPLTRSLAIDGPGVYLVELESRDRLGRVQVVTVDLYAGGVGDVGWPRAEAGVFEIATDANSYRPGDTAQLVLKSPYARGEALVVVETPTGNLYTRARIQGGSATVPIKVQEGWTPRVPVHVLLRRGRVEDAPIVGSSDLGKPASVASTTVIEVSPVENTVEVAVNHAERAMPGDTVEVEVALSDPDGRPLSGEVTLWLVDQAVLALGKEQRLDPLPDFLVDRRSTTQLHDTRNLAFGSLPYSRMPGGDGGGEEDSAADGVLDRASVRRNFEPVPYFAPAIAVGRSGRMTVRVQLPDNLTVFKIRAKATSGDRRFGHTKSEIRVRLPVTLQADLPRFVRPGDQLELAALARVIEGDPGPGNASLRAEGLTVKGAPEQRLAWAPTDAVRVAWEATVPDRASGEVEITIGAERTLDGASDAVNHVLPVRPDRAARAERTILALQPGETGTLPALEDRARAGTLERSLVLSDHPGIVGMLNATDILVRRPARSTAQHLDTARAWLGLGSMRASFGLQDDRAKADVNAALAWIPTVTTPSELLSQWPGGRGSVILTADALTLLVDAESVGYPVDRALRLQLVRVLKNALRSDFREFADGASWNERARALEALAGAGEFDESYFTELAENAERTGPDGLGSLLLAAGRAGRANGPVGQRLVRAVDQEVVLGLVAGSERYQGLRSHDPTSARIWNTESGSLARMTRGLLVADPTAAKLPLMVDGLVRLGGESGWGGSADAPALLALAERLRGRAATPVSITVDGVALDATEGLARLDVEGSDALSVRHVSGPAAASFGSAAYVPVGSGALAGPRNRGFVVEREAAVYPLDMGTPTRTRLTDGGQEIRLGMGQIVEEHIQVVNPETRSYVAIEVPLAAGLEYLNPALATSTSDAPPSRSDSVRATYVDARDDSVTWYFEQLPKGTVDLYLRTRATARGRFVQPPAVGDLVFDPAVTGSSAGARVIIE